MNRILYKTGDKYYSGIQKFNILADSTFRKCIIVFAVLTAIQIPTVIAFVPGPRREIGFIVIYLAYMLPAAFTLAGGMSKAAWSWYALSALLFAAGAVPVAMGASPLFMLFIPASVICIAMMDRAAPHILVALGYKTPAKPVTEITFAIIIAAVLIAYTWLGQELVNKSGYVRRTNEQYLWLVVTGVLYYSVLWGILHGILMRRFLDLRYEAAAPIALNTLLATLYWVPSVLGFGVKLQLAVGATVLQGICSQVALGLAFYFCRSTRPLLVAFIIYYLFLKSLNIG